METTRSDIYAQRLKEKLVLDVLDYFRQNNESSETQGYPPEHLKTVVCTAVHSICQSHGHKEQTNVLLEKVMFQVRLELAKQERTRTLPEPHLIIHTQRNPQPIFSKKMEKDEFAQLAWYQDYRCKQEQEKQNLQKFQKRLELKQSLDHMMEEKQKMEKEARDMQNEWNTKMEKMRQQKEQERIRKEAYLKEKQFAQQKENFKTLGAQILQKAEQKAFEKEEDLRYMMEQNRLQVIRDIRQEENVRRMKGLGGLNTAPISAQSLLNSSAGGNELKEQLRKYMEAKKDIERQHKREHKEALDAQINYINEKNLEAKRLEKQYAQKIMEAHRQVEEQKREQFRLNVQAKHDYRTDILAQCENDRARKRITGMNSHEKAINRELLSSLALDLRRMNNASICDYYSKTERTIR